MLKTSKKGGDSRRNFTPPAIYPADRFQPENQITIIEIECRPLVLLRALEIKIHGLFMDKPKNQIKTAYSEITASR
jgi:hypothetical protein